MSQNIEDMETAFKIAAMFPNDQENANSQNVINLINRIDFTKIDDIPSTAPKKNMNSKFIENARNQLLLKYVGQMDDSKNMFHETLKIGNSLKNKRLRLLNDEENSFSSISSIYEGSETEEDELQK